MLIVIGICLFKHLSLLISVKIIQLNGFYQTFFGEQHIHFDMKTVLMPDLF